jgi:hypothetical protein
MSEERKVKVWNRTKGIHDFVFQDKRKIVSIRPGWFTKIPLDEIYHVNNSSRSFKKGLLEIDPLEKEILEELGYEKRSPNVYSDDEIRKLLTGNFTKDVKEELSQITERHAKERLIEITRSLDLSRSKYKFIEDVTGMEIYNEIIDSESNRKDISSTTNKEKTNKHNIIEV